MCYIEVGRCGVVFLLKLWHFIVNHANRYEGYTTYFLIYVVSDHLECSRISAFLCKHFYANWRLEYEYQCICIFQILL